MQRAQNLILAVDIGGTKVAAGLVNSAGEVLQASRTRMVARRSAEEGLQAVFKAIDRVLRGRRARQAFAIGVSVPGWVDSRRGVLLSAANLPCWRNFPLAKKIEGQYKLRTRVGNDGNVAALAEAAWGAGAGYRKMFYVTLGTGIGTGIVLNHRIYDGRTGGASEGGHMTINFRGPRCGCGKRGCIEVYASGPAIARRARERLGKRGSQQSRILALAKGKIAAVTSEMVSKAASAGDALGIEVLEEAADYLAIWLGNIIDLLEPEIIVVGGGVGHLMTSYLGRIRDRLKVWALNPRQDEIPIMDARYGAESALVGAAAMCLSRAQVWGSGSKRI